jgi:hypothetical protein
VLLTNGWVNIFYIHGKNNVLWAVYAHWHSGVGWLVGANPVERPLEWPEGCQVVSR